MKINRKPALIDSQTKQAESVIKPHTDAMVREKEGKRLLYEDAEQVENLVNDLNEFWAGRMHVSAIWMGTVWRFVYTPIR